MESELSMGQYAAEKSVEIYVDSPAMAPRQRTSEESQIAENKAEIQQETAELENLQNGSE